MPTPDPYSPHTLSLIAKLAPGQCLQWVPVEPLPWAEELACIDVVDRVVSENGGRRVLGWALWEWPGVLIEGEFHAVWERPDGRLVDATPNSIKIQRILFLPDPKAEILTYQRDNIRRPLARRKEILDYIEIKERIFRAQNIDDGAKSRYYS